MDIQKSAWALGLVVALVGGSYSIAVVTVAPVERDVIHVSRQLDKLEGRLEKAVITSDK